MKNKTLNIQRYVLLTILVLCGISSYSQVIGDSVVAVANNWDVGEYALYKNYSGRIRIEGGDTITEREEPVTITKVLLKEVLPNEDKVFVITIEDADTIKTEDVVTQDPTTSSGNGEAKDNEDPFTEKDPDELRSLFRKLNETSVTILTDFSG